MKARWPTIKDLVPERAPNVIQVGANTGIEITAFKSLWPDAQVWAFEPRRDAFARMMATYGRARGVHLVNRAVSDGAESALFHINKQGGTSSLLALNPDSPYYRPAYATQHVVAMYTLALDTFCAAQHIDRVGFLMIDTQGAELRVLRGAEGLLGRGAVDVIYVEVFFIDLYLGCPQFADVRQYLESFGYRFVQFFNFGKAAGKPPTMWSDALFVKGDQ